jgi:predicted aspartyl protease
MMVGIVTSSDQATLKLQVLGPGGRSEEVEAIIDTGFNGDLALPPTSVAVLGLPVIGSYPAALADGSQITLNCYEAIAELYELTPERVRDVLRFAAAHQAEVSTYLADYRGELARQEADWQPTPAYLRIRQSMERNPGDPAEEA